MRVAESVVDEVVPEPRRPERALALASSVPVPESAFRRERALVAVDLPDELEVSAEVLTAGVMLPAAVPVVVVPESVIVGADTSGKPMVGMGVMTGAATVGVAIGFVGRYPA